MQLNKETFITGFALFSMFFGAGNLILPPNLGFKAGDLWFWVTIGFVISAVVIPLLGILAHARLQGTLFDFGKKVSPVFSFVYCLLIYTISIALPSPRTASVTHEMAIAPFFGTSSLLTSAIYFTLVLFFVLNRSKILNLLGKFLTPIIFIVILAIICIGIFSTHEPINISGFNAPIIKGLLEGYQTFDAIGAVVVGGVIIVSLKMKGKNSFEENKKLITSAGIIAGTGLFIIYMGLIYTGALFNGVFETTITRSELLSELSVRTLGNVGKVFLSVLVALACFTTAVGIVTGTADYIKGIWKQSQHAYIVTAVIGCILGVVIGQFDVGYIIAVAVPALMFIYPITIVLILLNVLPEKWTSPLVFRVVVLVTIACSLPDFLMTVGLKDLAQPILKALPLGAYSLAWVLPALFAFMIMNVLVRKSNNAIGAN